MSFDGTMFPPNLSPPYRNPFRHHFEGCEHKVLILKRRISMVFKIYECSACNEIFKIPILRNIRMDEEMKRCS